MATQAVTTESTAWSSGIGNNDDGRERSRKPRHLARLELTSRSFFAGRAVASAPPSKLKLPSPSILVLLGPWQASLLQLRQDRWPPCSVYLSVSQSRSMSSQLSTKRRDKRRHAPINNPFEILGLAIRLDERSEQLLRSPLKTSRLHNSKQYEEALDVVHEKTQGPSKMDFPDFALTPVILSGLLAEIETNEDTASDTLSLELVQFCHAMRRAALNRQKITQRRNWIQNKLLPILCVVGLIGLFYQHVARSLHAYETLGLGTSCFRMGEYEEACLMADSDLWRRFRDLPATCGLHCLLETRQEAPLSMHSLYYHGPLSEEEIRGDVRKDLSNLTRSVPNSFVDSILRRNFLDRKELRILDAGCGLGGTYHALVDHPATIYYDGITASEAEVRLGQPLLDTVTDKAKLRQQSFDDPNLPREKYDVIIAIESLEYSRNLRATVKNLLGSLRTGGSLLIVTDVALVATDHWLTAVEWFRMLEDLHCFGLLHSDLELLYEMVPEQMDWYWTDMFFGSSLWQTRYDMLEALRKNYTIAKSSFWCWKVGDGLTTGLDAMKEANRK